MSANEQLATLPTTAADDGLSLTNRLLKLIVANDTATITTLRDNSANQEDKDYFQQWLDDLPTIAGGGATGPSWTKYTLDTSSLTAGALSQAITLYTTSAEEIIEGCIIKHSALFSDGGSPTVTVEVGVSGDTTRYSPAYDIAQAVSDTARQATNVLDLEPSAIAIEATFTSSVNVNTLTTGSVDIWVKSGTL